MSVINIKPRNTPIRRLLTMTSFIKVKTTLNPAGGEIVSSRLFFMR